MYITCTNLRLHIYICFIGEIDFNFTEIANFNRFENKLREKIANKINGFQEKHKEQPNFPTRVLLLFLIKKLQQVVINFISAGLTREFIIVCDDSTVVAPTFRI